MNLSTNPENLPPSDVSEKTLVYSRLVELGQMRINDTAASYAESSRMFNIPPAKSSMRTNRRLAIGAPQKIQADIDILKWQSYLSRLAENIENFSEKHAKAVRAVWSKLVSRVGHILRAPIAGPGGELGFQFSWNTEQYYLDIDIDEEGHFEWFFTDKITGEDAGSEDESLNEPPEELLRLLVKFCIAK